MPKELNLSPKGQITIPKEVREALALKPGDGVIFSISDGNLVLTPKNIAFNDLAGFLGAPPNGRATLEEIDQTVAREVGQEAAGIAKTAKGRAA